MGNNGLIAGSLLAIVVCGQAFAQDDEERATYITILGNYAMMDEDRDGPIDGIDDAMGAQFIFGQQRASGFGFEATLFGDVIETGDGNGTDFYRPGLGLDIIYGFGDRKGFTPFLLLGAGGSYNDISPDSEDDYDWYGNAGLGFVTGPLNKYDIKLRAELRYLYDNFQDGYEDYKAGLGIEIPLYGEPKTIEKVVEKVKIVEVKPEGFGDADKDGIIDSHDQCPNTPEGTRVDGTGCPLGDVVALDGVTFETDSDRLRPDARTILDDAARVLERYPEMMVEIAGHTDSVGGDAYNQQLSQKRAESVLSYLTEKGIDAGRMTAVGYGESEPVDSNDSAEGRERNRRVELRIKN